MGIAVIVEAILSFVNLSISTDDPTWGGMIAEGRLSIHQAWWVLVFPLIMLFLTVLAFSQFGEGLKDALRSGAAMSRLPRNLRPQRRAAPTARACCARCRSTVEPGEVRGLVGESGAGKSMIGKAIFGILPPSVRIVEGAIRLEGTDLGSLSREGAPQR